MVGNTGLALAQVRIPVEVQAALAAYTLIGLVGATSPGEPTAMETLALCYLFAARENLAVHTDDRFGVAQIVRGRLRERARLHAAASPRPKHQMARAVQLVARIRQNKGMLVCLPDSLPDPQLVPGRDIGASFEQAGSSLSWAMTALAIGQHVATFVFVPPPLIVPEKWNLAPVGTTGWHTRNKSPWR